MMKLFRAKCLGTDLSIYLEPEHDIPTVQLKVLAHYIASGTIPFNERYILQVLEVLHDNKLLTNDSLSEAIPFTQIKESKSRLVKE